MIEFTNVPRVYGPQASERIKKVMETDSQRIYTNGVENPDFDDLEIDEEVIELSSNEEEIVIDGNDAKEGNLDSSESR